MLSVDELGRRRKKEEESEDRLALDRAGVLFVFVLFD